MSQGIKSTSGRQAFYFLSLLIIVIAVTHLGIQSPYTYMLELFKLGHPAYVDNIPLNWDAPKGLFLVDFFATGKTAFLAGSPNVKIPMYEFLLSIFWRLTNHLFLSILLLNVVALMSLTWLFCKLTARYGFDNFTTIIAGTLFLSLLWVTHYIAQPIQYVFAISLSFSILLFLFLEKEDQICPWQDGFLLAILVLTYDPYPYLLAFALFAWNTKRYKSLDTFIWLGIGFGLPIITWHLILAFLSPALINDEYYRYFIQPAIEGWKMLFDSHIFLSLSVIGTTTLTIVCKQILAQIYWPFLLVCIYWAYKYRRQWTTIPQHYRVMAAALFVSYFSLQFLTCVFDWENNPRRAFPLILALFLLLVPSLKLIMKDEKDRFLAVGVAMLGCLYCMADTLFNFFTIATQLSGQFVREESKFLMQSFVPNSPTGLHPFLGLKTLYQAWAYPTTSLTGIHFSWFWALATSFCLLMFGILFYILKNKFGMLNNNIDEENDGLIVMNCV